MGGFASAIEIQQRLQLAISSEDYPVTPGDVYRLTYRQADTPITADLLVESNYTINMKVFGSFYAAGMTFAQVKPLIEKAVTNAYPRSMPSVTIYSLGIFQVFLRGETPQSRNLVAWGLSRLSEMIETRRNPDSSVRNIKVIAKDGTEKSFDLFKAYRLGTSAEDPYVRPGDTIVLSRIERRVEVAGAVHQPGTYELVTDEGLRELVEFYGSGPTPWADVSRLRIERVVEERAKIEYVSLEEGYQKGTRLENGDIVSVPTLTANLPVVSFEGAVVQQAPAAAAAAPAVAPEEAGMAATPGYNRILYTFKEGETLSDAVRAVRGSIAPLADLSSASVLRQGSADPIFVDLRELLSKSVSPSDMPLQANDRIVIPLLTFSVFVSGAVEKPGTYPFAPGRTYHYYVILAGGSTQDAPGKIFITDVNGNMRDQKEPIRSEDRIFVIPATVLVQGAVFAPGSFPYREGLPVSYYVNLAGGVDPERNSGGRVRLFDSTGKARKATAPLMPGDRIYVPPNSFVYNLNMYASLVAVIIGIGIDALIIYNTFAPSP
ncbi:MAG: SLBB domain-containing protein [Armatimonadetes bacterium]|nr:SLBB domain-containing protein [Armatimonadota bacterium]